MEKEELLENLKKYQARLASDVRGELQQDYNLGIARLDSWCTSIQIFFEKNLPLYLPKLKLKINAPYRRLYGRSKFEITLQDKIEPLNAFIKSLIMDVNSDDYLNFETAPHQENKPTIISTNRKAFIVHGHDNATKERTARFLEKLGFSAVIWHEQVNGGKTIIEKLEHFTDVGFGIVLYTPDDVGEAIAIKDQLRSRARQNVVFEHGLLIGKLGRYRVFPLVTDNNVELPGDISGMVYLSDSSWEFQLAKEIRALGYEVDLNNL